MKDGLLIRRAVPADAAPLRAFLTPRFPGTMAARYDWLYERNPHGKARVWLAVERETGAIAGCTALFPRLVAVDSRRRVGSVGGDCLVDPRFRRQGVATALHVASLAEMRAAGVDFMYGPPAARNLAALVKAGARVVTGCRTWVRPLTAEGLARLLRRRRWRAMLKPFAAPSLALVSRLGRAPAGVTLEPLTSFGAEIDALSVRLADRYRVVCVRDAAWVRWRYAEAPARCQSAWAVRQGGALVGLVGLEAADSHVEMVDLYLPPDPPLVDATLHAVAEHAIGIGGHTLGVELSQGGPIARRLLRRGFLPGRVRRFQVLADAADAQAAALFDGPGWHFCVADEDLDAVLKVNRQPPAAALAAAG